jgi:saccharopine dehydrogenase (NAD+, L-lysine forming)
MKKVIIIGAGAQANVITGVLSRADDVSEILVTDIDEMRAKELAEVNGSKKVTAERIDASDIDGMAKRIKQGDFDLVVNATVPRFVHNVMKASLSAGIDYLDMASNEIYPEPDIPVEQFFYAEEWKAAGLKCLTGAGGDPGLSNIMAKIAGLELDEIEYMSIKDFGIAESEEPVALWSMETYLEDCYLPATIWEDGKPKKVDPFTGEEDYYFPSPLDTIGRCYFHDHEEAVTIPLYIGTPMKYCDFKLGEPGSEMWKFLIEGLGMMDPEPIDFGNGCKVSPREMLFKKIPATASPKKQIELYEKGKLESKLMLTCDAAGTKNGKQVRYKMWTNSPAGSEACAWIAGTNDVSWMTSIPASVFSLMMLRDQVNHTGVFPPEVFSAEEVATFLAGIKEWGITVKVQREEESV